MRYAFPVRSQLHFAASEVGRIQIIEDEPDTTMVDYLRQQDVDAVSVSGRQEMLRQFAAAEPASTSSTCSLVTKMASICFGKSGRARKSRSTSSRETAATTSTGSLAWN